MEALRQDDPRRFGPYTTLARHRETASAVSYLARGADAGELALITAARPALAAVPAFRRRFVAELRTAERLAGGWVQPPLDPPDQDAPASAGRLWRATRYLPALTLAEAVAVGGPLPERAVRILGAGVAEVLARVHATGSALQGLSPDTVLLASDGPRLTAFGPLGGASAAEALPGGQLSVRLGYLTPEQVAGEEAGPASDLFVLGLLLAYAATGATPFAEGPAGKAADRIAHGEPGLDGVPAGVRELIAGCLAKDPHHRPSAATVAAALALEGAAALARSGWLPGPLSAAVADQEARVRALEPPRDGGTSGDGPAGAGDDPAATGTAGDVGNVSGTGNGPRDDSVPREGEATTRFPDTRAREPESDSPTTRLMVTREHSAGRALATRPPAPVAPAVPPAVPSPGSLLPARRPLESPSGSPLSAHVPTAPAYPVPYSGTSLPGASLPGGGASRGAGPGALPAARPHTGPEGAALFPTRRSLLATVAAGAFGLLVGGIAVGALGTDGTSTPAEDDEPAPSRAPVLLPGQAPALTWTYAHPAAEAEPLTAALWQDRLLVLTSKVQASAVDLRTGERVWQRADGAEGQAALAAGDDLVFVAGPTAFLWLSPTTGEVKHRVLHADGFAGLPGLRVGTLTGHSGSVVWFCGARAVTVKAPKPAKGKKPGKDRRVVQAYFFAYDLVRREEVWRVQVPAGRGASGPEYRLAAARLNDIVVRQDASALTPDDVRSAKGKGSFRCFDRRTGKLLWTKAFGALSPAGAVGGDEEGRLFGAVGDDLEAWDTESGKPLWRLDGTGRSSEFGPPVESGELIVTTNRSQEVGLVERETGKLLWLRSTEVPAGGAAPALTVTASGDTILASDTTQVTAFDARDGRRLWKFQDIGVQEPGGAAVTGPYRVLTTARTAVVLRGRAVYAFPVA
ncbi:PQQ-binding-like beta-propeller repeat protein [Streptomyces sp. NBC_01218]|uniref:outer membrane protein assembly factor BamB family protein n=1 Tax=Streptomyces sp. NBC_01218 TaxID=2903780 RepID=UPI002E11760F|nr:PQQ-binding-like beta-propeller repeat protein [Streptomyces sp. NBC_01218]